MKKEVMRGHIKYFDNLSGQGVVSCENGQNYFLHYSASNLFKQGKRVEFSRFTPVEFTLYVDAHFIQVDTIKKSNWTSTLNIKCDLILNALNQSNDHILYNAITN